MKRNHYYSIFLLLLVLQWQQASATIRRVDFFGSITLVAGTDYPNFQAAHDAAAAGDTIQLYPGTSGNGVGYSGIITKRLVIMGPGYWYNSYNLPASGIFNPNLQALPGNNISNSFNLGSGSSGTALMGLYSTIVTVSTPLDSIKDILITRCRNITLNINNFGVCHNWKVSKCYRVYVNQNATAQSADRSISDLRVENCIGLGINFGVNSAEGTQGKNSGMILNCVFSQYSGSGLDNPYTGGITLNNAYFIIQNCIDATNYFSTQYMAQMTNTIFINNMTTATPLNNFVATNPGSAGNIFGASFAGNAIFESVPNNISGSTTLNSPDAAYRLSASSPAKNAGVIPGSGLPTDLGAFGGTDPYQLSGIPTIPSFFRFNSASTTAASSPYPVTYSVRGNN
ncbi:MAG: hypothetical protein V4722_24795 [Bacteroidota bacterium]